MFGALLESTRSGDTQVHFTAMSVVAHATLIIAAVVATTSAGKPAAEPLPPEVVPVMFHLPEPPQSPTASPEPRTRARPQPATLPSLRLPRAMILTVGVPRGLPSIDIPLARVHSGRGEHPRSTAGSPITGSYLGSGTSAAGSILEATQVDRAVTLRTSAEPVYPAVLRTLGVEGEVRVRFVVDTLGRVEPGSVEIRSSAHDAFSGAVRDVLPRLRFRRAEAAGSAVRQLVEMPFVFTLRR